MDICNRKVKEVPRMTKKHLQTAKQFNITFNRGFVLSLKQNIFLAALLYVLSHHLVLPGFWLLISELTHSHFIISFCAH